MIPRDLLVIGPKKNTPADRIRGAFSVSSRALIQGMVCPESRLPRLRIELYCATVCTTLPIGRELTAGSFKSFISAAS